MIKLTIGEWTVLDFRTKIEHNIPNLIKLRLTATPIKLKFQYIKHELSLIL